MADSFVQQFADDPTEQTIKQWAMDQLAGKNIPSADQLYKGAAPAIQASAYNLAGSTAGQMASKGIAGSGYDRQQSVANVAQKEGNDLAQAKLSAAQKAQGLKDTAFDQGTTALRGYEDAAMRAQTADAITSQMQTNITNTKQNQDNQNNLAPWQVAFG